MRFIKQHKNFCLLILVLVVGCTPLEGYRRLAGKSISHLEKYRDRAISQYVNCQIAECYQIVLAIGTNQPADPLLKKHFVVFQANERQGFIVFYSIPGQIDTTEVAVFFAPEAKGTRIEIVSLSSGAKEKVAVAVFTELRANYLKIFIDKLILILYSVEPFRWGNTVKIDL